MLTKQNIPNFLTLLRGVLTFLIILLFSINFPNQFAWIYVFFLIASVTDFVDGYLARKWKVISTFGIIFDPLFDKVLVLSLFMLLIPFDIVPTFVYVIFLIREILTSSLKSYLLSKGIAVPAIKTAKWKTVFHMLFLHTALLILMFPSSQAYLPQTFLLVLVLFVLAKVFAYIGLALSLWSGGAYVKIFLDALPKIDKK